MNIIFLTIQIRVRMWVLSLGVIQDQQKIILEAFLEKLQLRITYSTVGYRFFFLNSHFVQLQY